MGILGPTPTFMRHGYRTFLLLGLFNLPLLAYGQQTRYVKADAGGANDGSSWTDAFIDLQDALAAAAASDVIWIAAGTYRPHVPLDPNAITVADRSIFFDLKPGIALFGGFAGSETRLDQRDIEANRTILSGDLLDNDNDVMSIHEPTRADNSFHVVRARELQGTPPLLDGFTITGGNANPPPLNNNNSGGGMEIREANPVVRNTLFIANTAQFGGGMSILVAGALLQDVSFQGNTASKLSNCIDDSGCAGNGGGLFSNLSGLALEHVTFIGNVAENDGGGMYNVASEPVITYATFDHNRAQRGGGILNRSSNVEHKVVNAAFYGNEATLGGGGMYNDDANPVLINVVFSGNRSTNPDNRGGGGMYNITLENSQLIKPVLWNVTFSGNRSESDGGAIFNHNANLDLIHTILWNNEAQNGTHELGRFDSRGGTRIGSSLIEGGLPDWVQDQGGNLDADPLFANPAGDDGVIGTEDDDLHLQATSPAIDVGRNELLPPDIQDLDLDDNTGEDFPIDLEGRVRAFDGGSGSSIVDIGAYEYGAPFAIPTAVEPEPEEVPDEPAVVSTFPNPFHERVTLRYEVTATGPVTLHIYDMLGKAVATLVDAVQPPGTYEATFDAPNLPSGVYLYRLETAGRHATGKMLHVR